MTKQTRLKKVYDPVHGFIRLSPAERDLIDSYAFQRLHYIRQLGVSYLVYPGATHTRFEHSLGVMEVAGRIFDKILENCPYTPDPESVRYRRQIVRFAALCHDLGHLPFSHVAEKRILGDLGHEAWTAELIRSSFLSPVFDRFQAEFPDRDVLFDLVNTSIGEEKRSLIFPGSGQEMTPWERVTSQIVTGDFFGADRIDYLLRDARCTGVSYGLFDYHQLIETLRILPDPDGRGLMLGVEESGIESCEALLLARHFMHKRVYQHPSVQSYSFHTARFMEKMYARENPLLSVGTYLSYTDDDILAELKKAFLDPSHEAHEDALPLFVRESRYLAFELPATISQEEIENWKKEFPIGEGKAESFFFPASGQSIPSFPVLRGGKVFDATRCSEFSIPTFSGNRLYVSPKHRDSVEHLLNPCR